MAGNDFKAFIFKELGDIRMEMAENARATKLRKTDDTESTNSGTSSLLSHRSSTSDAENQSIFATPLAEQPSEIRALLEKAVALVAEGVWSRSTCQRYFAALRKHYEPDMLQPTRVESLSFLQLQELCAKLQLSPPKDIRDLQHARAAISKNCIGLTEYCVARYLAEQTARSAAFLAEQRDVLSCGIVIQYASRGIVTTAMVISPVVFYDQTEGHCVQSLSYKAISLDDDGIGYAKAQDVRKVLVDAVTPPALPPLQMWTPAGELAQEFEEGARQRKCFMKAEALQQLSAELGIAHEGLKREKLMDKLAAWASKACAAHVETQLRRDAAV